MRTAFQVQFSAIYQRSKPVRDRRYLQFIKRFPCVACSGTRCVDPCHTGPHGIGQKSSDMHTLPFCRKCHDSFDAAPADFAQVHQLDIPSLISFFNHLWELKDGTS